MTNITQQTTQRAPTPVVPERQRPDRLPEVRKPRAPKGPRWVRWTGLVVVVGVTVVLAVGLLTGGDSGQAAPEPDALDRYVANHPQAAEPDALDRYLANN